MSADVSLCLIWILYGPSWRSFFGILCDDARERPSSWEYLQRNFFGLLPIESLTASTLSGHLAVNFLDMSGIFCLLYEGFFLQTMWLEICVLLRIVVKVKFPAKFCLHSFEWFCLQISSDVRYFFLSCRRNCDQGLIVVIVSYFKIWHKKHNIIDSSSRVINSHMGPMYIEAPYNTNIIVKS